eukprot:scaffold15137_cov20-Tisochrysis_lutea.AAC.1
MSLWGMGSVHNKPGVFNACDIFPWIGRLADWQFFVSRFAENILGRHFGVELLCKPLSKALTHLLLVMLGMWVRQQRARKSRNCWGVSDGACALCKLSCACIQSMGKQKQGGLGTRVASSFHIILWNRDTDVGPNSSKGRDSCGELLHAGPLPFWQCKCSSRFGEHDHKRANAVMLLVLMRTLHETAKAHYNGKSSHMEEEDMQGTTIVKKASDR